MASPNKYQVIVSEQAKRMLISHAVFLAQVSPEAAERLVDSFETAANSLDTMPSRCPWLTGDYIPKNSYHFFVFEKRYLIIFQIQDDIVYIDYVVDSRQDYGWLIH